MIELSDYIPTPLEQAVQSFYQTRGIYNPSDIDLVLLATEAGIWIHELPHPSNEFEFFKNQHTIVVDSRVTRRQQRVELAHELGHARMHTGRQEFLPPSIGAHEEWQANRFAMYALAPSFMLLPYIEYGSTTERLIPELADVFDLPDYYVKSRLQLLHERIQSLQFERQMQTILREDHATYDCSYRHPLDSTLEYLVKDGEVIGRRKRADW